MDKKRKNPNEITENKSISDTDLLILTEKKAISDLIKILKNPGRFLIAIKETNLKIFAALSLNGLLLQYFLDNFLSSQDCEKDIEATWSINEIPIILLYSFIISMIFSKYNKNKKLSIAFLDSYPKIYYSYNLVTNFLFSNMNNYLFKDTESSITELPETKECICERGFDKQGCIFKKFNIDYCPVKNVGNTGNGFEFECGNIDEGYFYRIETYPVKNKEGEIINIVVELKDILKYKKKGQEIIKKAQLDPLTGLYNLATFKESIGYKLEEFIKTRNNSFSGVIFLDLDGFKPFNDIFGHSIGDKVLIEVAKRIKSCLRESDLTCRYGGDEFVIFLSDIRNKDDVKKIIKKIKGKIAEPISFKGINCKDYLLNASFGYKIFQITPNCNDFEKINGYIKSADQQMLQEKEKKKRHRFL